ncbi:PHB depolymerase family esterase [Planosporangium thailandense]|uniref:PHB depolymerase family esterase n=1 Tax=Planosporangium thailandense TaxID=765197 RepID=A0ABX0Y573_9ACTN|nr:PHB depolymerase family esterase [Planosporangium thailandense]NJC73551.1 PHB depolymerase family esterase [Planosporangium thailandense]
MPEPQREPSIRPAPTRRRAARKRLVLIAFVAAVLGLVPATTATAAASPTRAATGGTSSGTYFAGVYASLGGVHPYHGYVPSSYRPGTPMPLLVALHGCTENDIGFDLLSGWSARAEQRGFIVVFPEQPVLHNPAACWNWMLPFDQHRGGPEPSAIVGIADLVRGRYTVDAHRVYVTGVSAGGCMANIMAVTYPDVFAAVSILAGCEYKAGVITHRPPAESGRDAYREMGGRARAVPTLIFQGTADKIVPPDTADRIVGQWVETDNLAGVDVQAAPAQVIPGQVPGGRSYTRSIYRTSAGAALVEKYMINGAGHVYPGGCWCSLYGDPSGPDATGITWDFFLAHPKP